MRRHIAIRNNNAKITLVFNYKYSDMIELVDRSGLIVFMSGNFTLQTWGQMKKYKKKIELENNKFPAYLQLKNLDCMKQLSIEFDTMRKKITFDDIAEEVK